MAAKRNKDINIFSIQPYVGILLQVALFLEVVEYPGEHLELKVPLEFGATVMYLYYIGEAAHENAQRQ
jgi:hypothetical protein